MIGGLDAAAGLALASYLRQPGYGLFFDPAKNHDAWVQTAPLSEKVAALAAELVAALDARFPLRPDGDAAAEEMEADPDEVSGFEQQIATRSFAVPDSTTTAKTRGSAQRAFAKEVKANYGSQCAITGIKSSDFLVAAHIVPWSKDQSIRLDPSNGICLSLIMDRAFEKGYILIEDDLTIRVAANKIEKDGELLTLLAQYDGRKLNAPKVCGPKREYLQRRRGLVEDED